jgi:hypothetical protein
MASRTISAVPSVSVARVMLASLRAWRRDFFFLTVLAAIVETPIVLLELTLHVAPGIEVPTGSSATGSARILTVGVPLMVYGVLAHHFLSGVMESVEGAERHGHARPTLRELARTLPWGKLLIADLVTQVILLLGLLMFVIPGLVAGAYLAAALPLTNMERQPIWPTIRRSVAITRGHFWKALAIWLITSVVVDGLQTAATEYFGHLTHSQVGEFIAHLGSDVLFLPLQALPIVMLTFDLVAVDKARRAAAVDVEPAPGVAEVTD